MKITKLLLCIHYLNYYYYLTFFTFYRFTIILLLLYLQKNILDFSNYLQFHTNFVFIKILKLIGIIQFNCDIILKMLFIVIIFDLFKNLKNKHICYIQILNFNDIFKINLI